MKNRFKYIVMLLLFAMPAITACAQEKTEDIAKKMTDVLKGQLALNDTQYQQVYDVNTMFINEAKALKESDEGRRDKASKLKASDEARDAKMKKILTESQYKTFLEKKKENRKKLKEWYKENH